MEGKPKAVGLMLVALGAVAVAGTMRLVPVDLADDVEAPEGLGHEGLKPDATALEHARRRSAQLQRDAAQRLAWSKARLKRIQQMERSETPQKHEPESESTEKSDVEP